MRVKSLVQANNEQGPLDPGPLQSFLWLVLVGLRSLRCYRGSIETIVKLWNVIFFLEKHC